MKGEAYCEEGGVSERGKHSERALHQTAALQHRAGKLLVDQHLLQEIAQSLISFPLR